MLPDSASGSVPGVFAPPNLDNGQEGAQDGSDKVVNVENFQFNGQNISFDDLRARAV